MASLRVFAPSHCMLFQLPAPLRQCSSFHISLLPRPSVPLTRLFHASAAHAVRKPSGAVVKPTKASSSSPSARRRPSSAPKKLDTPLTPLPPSSSPQPISIQTTSTPHPTKPHQISVTARLVQSPSKTSHAPVELYTTPPASKTPQEYAPPSARPTPQYQTLLNQLATRSEPTVIYSSHGQWIFITVCVTSAFFFTYFAWVNIPTIRFAINTEAVGLLMTGTLAAVAMSGASVAFGLGPRRLIKRIVALPAMSSKHAQAAQKNAQGLQPTLRFEPVRIGFGVWPKPFEVQVGDTVSDRPFALEMEKWAPKYSSNPFRLMFTAFLGMFNRRDYFSYVRVEGHGNWKMHLQNAQALDGGKAFDQLVRVDRNPVNWRAKMLVRS